MRVRAVLPAGEGNELSSHFDLWVIGVTATVVLPYCGYRVVQAHLREQARERAYQRRLDIIREEVIRTCENNATHEFERWILGSYRACAKCKIPPWANQ